MCFLCSRVYAVFLLLFCPRFLKRICDCNCTNEFLTHRHICSLLYIYIVNLKNFNLFFLGTYAFMVSATMCRRWTVLSAVCSVGSSVSTMTTSSTTFWPTSTVASPSVASSVLASASSSATVKERTNLLLLLTNFLDWAFKWRTMTCLSYFLYFSPTTFRAWMAL